MGLDWTWWAAPGLFGAAVAIGAVVVLLKSGADRPVNRRLSVVLALEAVWLAGAVFWLIEEPDLARAVAAIAVGAMAAIPFQYLAFLGVALETPLVRPFRSRTAFLLLGLASIAAFLIPLIRPGAIMGPLYSPEWATWNWTYEPAGVWIAQAHGIASLFGLVAALHAFWRARRRPAARQRAMWFAIAFGVRDAFNAFWWISYPVLRPTPFWGDFLSNIGPSVVALLYIALLSYGVLRFQLLEIDLKIKFALEKGAVGAFFAAAFFLGSELLERVVPVEGTILGLLVAAAIVLILRPIQRVASGLANRLMGDVEDTPGYRQERRFELYRAALEGAFEDGRISKRERAILVRIRDQLGLDSSLAERLERELVSAP